MFKTILFVVCLGIIMSCSGENKTGDSETMEKESALQKTVAGEPNDNLIAQGQVGVFFTGEVMPSPAKLGDLTIEKVVESVEEEGEKYDYTRAIVSKGDQQILKIMEYDPASDKVHDIYVSSDIYSTDLGIKVGSTLKEFITKYPDCQVWYTYVADIFVAETDSVSEVQFILNPESYKGDKKKLYETDTVDLTPDDFTEQAFVKVIRVL